ncbi:MAG TPA: hypothetical protein VGD65_25815 [Chryseosolibacter sp.]
MPLKTSLLFACLYAVVTLTTHAQHVEQKVNMIDSLSTLIDNNVAGLKEGISEGTLFNKHGKNIGGYSTYTLADNASLYRVRHEVSTDLFYKTTFYYQGRQLCKAMVVIEEWKSGQLIKTVYSASYYFEGKHAIKIIGENEKFSDAEEILSDGETFMMEFTNR